jgi:hypothetical protein
MASGGCPGLPVPRESREYRACPGYQDRRVTEATRAMPVPKVRKDLEDLMGKMDRLA